MIETHLSMSDAPKQCDDHDSIDFNYLNDNLFFEAINLILPRSSELSTKRIQRSTSVPNDLVSLGEHSKAEKTLKFDIHDPNGIDYVI
jgi:hypothetical protein